MFKHGEFSHNGPLSGEPQFWCEVCGRAHHLPVHPPPAPQMPAYTPASALGVQVAGSHYKSLKIQPIEYIHANGIPFAEGCVIKYVTRWRDKGGIKDLEKAKHFIELLIELETRNGKV